VKWIAFRLIFHRFVRASRNRYRITSRRSDDLLVLTVGSHRLAAARGARDFFDPKLGPIPAADIAMLIN
jgi:hypothetical protein